MKNKFVYASVVVVILFAGFWWLKPLPPAPSVTFKTLDNQSFSLKDFSGKAVIISFWASNCPSCLQEIPDFLTLYRQYHAQGLEIIAVSMPYDIPSHVVALKQRLKIPYYLVLDLQGRINSAFGGIALTPTSLLISPEGKIIWHHTGRFSVAEMTRRIGKLLGKH